MQIRRRSLLRRPGRLTIETLRLIGILATATLLFAQSRPASITTTGQPAFGPAFFDNAGNIYYTDGPVTPGAAQTQTGGGTCFVATGFIGSIPTPCTDAHVVKVDANANVVWGTLLGGSTEDSTSAIAVDAAGTVYFVGSTRGSLPTTPGAAIEQSTTYRTFAAHLSSDGSRFLYVTYLPVTSAAAIAVDGSGNAYVTGQSIEGQPCVLKLDPPGSQILFNVPLPGIGTATSLTVDAGGSAIVAAQTAGSGAAKNILLAKLDPAGSVVFNTHLGGSGADFPAAVRADGNGNLYVAGSTTSFDFPTTPGTFQSDPILPAWNNFGPSGFAAKFDPSGSLLWATYVISSDGGLQVGGVVQMDVTASGELYLAGLAGATFPVTPSAPVACFPGSNRRLNPFVAHLDRRGALADATFLGPDQGSDANFVWGMALDSGGLVRVVWHAAGNDTLSQLQFGGGGWTAPACLSESVLNAASQSAMFGIAAGELVTLTGFGIGPDTGVVDQTGGVQVLFDGVAAPVLYAQSRQINAIAPVELAGKTSTTVSVKYGQREFGPVFVPVTFGSPGIFRFDVGRSAQAFAMNEDNTLNGPSNPAARGSIVAIWTTGYGPTNPACQAGAMNLPYATGLAPGIQAQTFDGRAWDALYAGSAPGKLCGIVQVNFRVPDTAPSGDYFFTPWVALEEGYGFTANQPHVGATIAVK